MSIASLNPSAELSITRPCRSSLGAKAMEWSAISRLPQELADRLEDRFELPVLADVAGSEDGRPELVGQRLDIRLRLLVQVGHREIRSELPKNPSASVGDRVLVGDADDEGTLPLKDLGLRGDLGEIVRLVGHAWVLGCALR